jgi:threonine/homoserine/homoserine lactone efflux protein
LGLRERFGCFFLAVGFVLLLLFALPTVQAFQRNPASVPVEWFGIAGGSIVLLWVGWKLYTSARRNAPSQKPPSLGARITAHWKSDDGEKNDD